jgi:hypothetical protein
VKLESDADLDIGVFGIATRLVRGPGKPAPEGAPAEQATPGMTMVYKAVPPPEPSAESEAVGEVQPSAVLTIAGQRHELDGERAVIGRSKDCDIQISDPNVSRRHAEVRRDGNAYTVVDLDSTNGIEVGGKRVKRLELHDGSRFTIGSTEIVFSEENH